jgi:hypothetical protein
LFDAFNGSRFLQEYVCRETGGIVEILESTPPLAGKVAFAAEGTVICVRNPSNQPPLRWTKNKKSADGAILVEVNGGVVAHLVELKGKIGPGTWRTVKEQFAGMYLNVLAVLEVGELSRPTTAVCHVAYERDAFIPDAAVDPVLLKVPIGGSKPYGRGDEWYAKKIQLDDLGVFELRKIKRDEKSHAGTGML